MEALETLVQFNGRLLGNLPTLIGELSGNRQPDTDTYLKNIVDVIGWEITVINATAPLLAEARTHMDKEHFNQSILAVNTKRLDALTFTPAQIAAYQADISFVGHLYNSPLDALLYPADEYCKGFVEGLIQAQLRVYVLGQFLLKLF